MKKTSSIGVISQPLSYSAWITVSGSSLSQIYDNSTGAYSPDRNVTPSTLTVHVKGTDPNKATASATSVTPTITSVVWEYVPSGSAAPVTIASSTNDYTLSGNDLVVNRNFDDKDTGGLFRATVYFTDTTTGRSLSATASIPLKTTLNTVNALSLVVSKGTDTTIPYAGDEYTINPLIRPLTTDGDNWKVHCAVQLCDGQIAITDAYKYGDDDEADRQGNAFYFWYTQDNNGVLTRLTGDTDWFTCKKRKDGTFAKECTVDLAKIGAVKLVARAEYVPYGSLVDYMDESGLIQPSKSKRGYLTQVFNLRASIPPIQRIDIASLQRDTLKESEIADTSNTIGRKALITAGGVCVNELDNPISGDTRNMADIMFSIKWYVDDGNGNPKGDAIGEGETLSCTLEKIRTTAGITTLTKDNLPNLLVVVDYNYPDLFGNNYCDEYLPSSDNVTPVVHHGNKSFLTQLDFMLFACNTDNENDDGTYNASLLQRNNLFHYAGGGYAPVVGITSDQKAECDGVLYSDSAGKTQAYAAGAYGDGTAEWEQHDKALMAAGSSPRTLYKKASDGTVSAVTHKLRPWETTRTDLSIGIGYTFPVYLLDQVTGKSGSVWKGIFTDVTEWDGIDISKYKLEPTALGPCAFTTVGNKARTFFYLYEPSDANSQGCTVNDIDVFHEARAYPRANDVSEVTSMTYCRASNKDTTSPVPMAEGGYFCYDTLVTAVELAAGTKCLHDINLFGSGISSNNTPTASTFYNVGGVRYKKSSDSSYSYAAWGASVQTLFGLSSAYTWSSYLNNERPKEQCMEAQMAMSMAVELGISPTTASGSEKTFEFYGNKYYYMTAGTMTTPAGGQMNARLYKVIDYSKTINGTAFEMQFRLRMSLYSGMTLAGDVFVYCGGGAELVAEALNKRDDNAYGNKIEGFWLQPSQKDWKRITTVSVAVGTKFGFEDDYIREIDGDDGSILTVNGSWKKERYPYSSFSNVNSSSAKGDCFAIWIDNWWDTSANGNRTRLALRFGVDATGGDCAPRSVSSHNSCSYALRGAAGRAQARVSIMQ